jgi:hypothetical protein
MNCKYCKCESEFVCFGKKKKSELFSSYPLDAMKLPSREEEMQRYYESVDKDYLHGITPNLRFFFLFF